MSISWRNNNASKNRKKISGALELIELEYANLTLIKMTKKKKFQKGNRRIKISKGIGGR